MNNKKYMAFFVLLFITLLSCAVITAADTTNNVTAEKTVSKDTITQKAVQTDKNVKNIDDEKTKTIEKKVTNNKKEQVTEVEASDYVALEKLVNEAKTSDNEYVIKYTGIDEGIYGITNTLKWDSTTPKSLTINGNGAILDMCDMQFITISKDNELILGNITIKNAKATNGAAIYNDGILVVENSTFQDNIATNYGGAIYSNKGVNAQLLINNTKFINNKANVGGAIFANLGSTLVVDGTNFTGNRAINDTTTGDGGAIYVNNATTSIVNSNFRQNYANVTGGAVAAVDSVDFVISNTNFTNNDAYFGGAVYSNLTLNLDKVLFEENSARMDGAGIYSNRGKLNINDTIFNHNTASVDGKGGAIYNYETALNVINSKFVNNEARDGGAVHNSFASYSSSSVSFVNDTFTANKARSDNPLKIAYGGAIWTNMHLTVNGSNFTENTAKEGGAIYTSFAFDGFDTVIDRCNFTANSATENGGVIVATYKTDIINSNFKENTATSGSVVYAKPDLFIDLAPEPVTPDVSIESCSFDSNVASDVGTLYVADKSKLTAKDSTFTDNRATSGSVLYQQGTSTLDTCTINDNDENQGDLIYTESGTQTTITDSTINTPKQFTDITKGEGQTIGTQVTVNDLFLAETDFTAPVVYPITNVSNYQELVDLVNAVKTNAVTYDITANLTGTEYTETVPIVIDDTFKPNLFTIEGNGKIIDANKKQFLTINAGKNVTINNLTIQNAEADQYGAAIFNNGNLSVNAVTFKKNTVKGDDISAGAAIYSEGNVTVNNSVFVNNTIGDGIVGGYGAAIYTEGPLYVYNSAFNNNSIESKNLASGGAIAVYGSTSDFIVDNSTFAGCVARHGGAILVMDIEGRNQGNKIINNCTFEDNRAIYGGAIETFNDLIIENSSFKENSVYGIGSGDRNPLGGAICVNNMVDSGTPGSITVRNSTFIENTAPHSSSPDETLEGFGGAIFNAGPNSVVDNCTFTSNEASLGGALLNSNKLTVTNSNFTGNQAFNGSVVYQSGELILDNSLINNNFAGLNYVIANKEARSITFTNNNITQTGGNLISTDVETKVASGNKYAQGNVVVAISPISDVTIIDTEETTNIPVMLTIDSIYGITSMDDAQIKVTVNEDVQNAYQFPVSGTGSTIAIPVSDLSASNAVVAELVSDSGIYTVTPESVSFNIYKLITTQLTVNALDIYAGDNVTISGTLQKDGTGLASKTIKLVINDVEYTTTTDDNGYFEFTNLIINDVTSEVVVTARFVETGYAESTATASFAVLERPPIIPTNITVEDIGDLHVNDKVNLTSYVKDDLGRFVDEGFVIFRINGKTLRDDEGNVMYVRVDGGKAVLHNVSVTQVWAKEDSKIQAYYTGTNDYDMNMSGQVSVSVVKYVAFVDVPSISGVAGQNISIKASVTSNGASVPVGRVAIKIDGKTLKDSNGKALYVSVDEITQGVNYTLPAKIKAGNPHNLTVVFSDPTFDRATGSATLTVSKE